MRKLLSATARKAAPETSVAVGNPLAHPGLAVGSGVDQGTPWLADNARYTTGDAPDVAFAGAYIGVPLQGGPSVMPGGNEYVNIPNYPVWHLETPPMGGERGRVGAAYYSGLDEDIPGGLANAPRVAHLGYNAAPNSVSINGASGGNNNEAVVSPLGYTNPALAPDVVVGARVASPSVKGARGLAVPVVLGGNSIG